MSIPFDQIASHLLTRAESLCREWLPAGKREGNEYRIGNLRGDPGKSLSINLTTGVWKDFAGDDGGADLISLYAGIHNLSQADAARALAPHLVNGHDPAPVRKPLQPAAQPAAPPAEFHPPTSEPPTDGAAAVYRYTDSFYVARFESAEGKKTFTPYTWNGTTWIRKAPAKPRPLFNLDGLRDRPDAPVLVVEGEKTAAAAASVLQAYVVVTWAGGASSTATADWSPLYGRKVDIWPDADEPGRQAAASIAGLLLNRCPAVRVVSTHGVEPAGWDIADAVADGWDSARILAWGKERITTPSVQPQVAKSAPMAPESAKGDSPLLQTDLPAYVLWEQLNLARNERGPYATEANALRIMSAHGSYAGRIWLDEFSQRLMIDDRLFSRTDAIACLVWMQEALQLPKMPLAAVERAAMLVGEKNKRHPLREYLTSLSWDGVERLPTLMSDAFGAVQDEYSAAVGRCWLVAMVARVMQPGCKHDLVPVLEGAQGLRKSSALSILGGQWFLESTEDPVRNRKDFLLSMQGKWLIEIPEIDRVGGNRGSLNDLTALITIRVDTYRVPYGATTMDYPRQSVIAGTANRSEWNPDQTGGRRFLPITCGAIDIEYLKAQRDQLFAEAVHRYNDGQEWWDVPETQAAEQQESRRLRDEWETVIERYIRESPDRRDWQAGIIWFPRETPLEILRMSDLLSDALGLPEGRWDRASQMRVASCLTALNWRRTKLVIDGVRQWVYVKFPKTSG